MADTDGLLPVDHSGARELVGYRSSLPDADTGACELVIGPQHLNRMGVLHGGFVAMLLDNGCGTAVRNVLGDINIAVMTVNMAVTYVKAAREGQVIATGRVVGGGRSLKFAEAHLRDENGDLLASATATFKVLSK